MIEICIQRTLKSRINFKQTKQNTKNVIEIALARLTKEPRIMLRNSQDYMDHPIRQEEWLKVSLVMLLEYLVEYEGGEGFRV